MKSLRELYQILLDNFLDERGICYNIIVLYVKGLITADERNLLTKHLHNNRPKRYSRFWWNRAYSAKQKFWWTLDTKGYEQRKSFIKYQILKEWTGVLKNYTKSY